MTLNELKEFAKEKQKIWQVGMKAHTAIGEIIDKMDELQKTIMVEKEQDINLEELIEMDEIDITVKFGSDEE